MTVLGKKPRAAFVPDMDVLVPQLSPRAHVDQPATSSQIVIRETEVPHFLALPNNIEFDSDDDSLEQKISAPSINTLLLRSRIVEKNKKL